MLWALLTECRYFLLSFNGDLQPDILADKASDGRRYWWNFNVENKYVPGGYITMVCATATQNTNSSFQKTNSSFQKTNSSFQSTNSSFQNTNSSFQNTNPSFQNTNSSFQIDL